MFLKTIATLALIIGFSFHCFAKSIEESGDIHVISPCSVDFGKKNICGSSNVLLEFAVDPRYTNKTENFQEATILVCLSQKEVIDLLKEQDGPLPENLTVDHQLRDIKMTYLVSNDQKLFPKPVTEKVFNEYRRGREGYFHLFKN